MYDGHVFELRPCRLVVRYKDCHCRCRRRLHRPSPPPRSTADDGRTQGKNAEPKQQRPDSFGQFVLFSSRSLSSSAAAAAAAEAAAVTVAGSA